MEEAKIIFKDGTSIKAEMNGSCFIVANEPVFPDDLSVVVVVAGGETRTYTNAYVQECASVDGNYWFTILEESIQDRTIRELREENTMLEDAIAELAEIIGGEE